MAYQLKNPKKSAAILAGVGQGLSEGVKTGLQFYLAHQRNKQYEDYQKLLRDRFDYEVGTKDKAPGPIKTKTAAPRTSPPDTSPMGGTPDAPTETEGEGPATMPPNQTGLEQFETVRPEDTMATMMPAYRRGTPFVPRTGPALLHQGEEVVSADENPNNPGVALAQDMEPPPRADVLARPQTLAMEGPTGGAMATPVGGGPLQQAEEMPDTAAPEVIGKYRQMGRDAKARENFMLQLKTEMEGYKGMEADMAQHIFQARHLKQQLDIARASDPEKVPAIEAKLLEMQGMQKYYEKQLGDFRQSVLGLAMDENGQVTDKDLHDGLTHWLDKGTTRGERAVLEQNLTHKPKGPGRMPGGAGGGVPRMRRQSGLVSPMVLGSRQS